MHPGCCAQPTPRQKREGSLRLCRRRERSRLPRSAVPRATPRQRGPLTSRSRQRGPPDWTRLTLTGSRRSLSCPHSLSVTLLFRHSLAFAASGVFSLAGYSSSHGQNLAFRDLATTFAITNRYYTASVSKQTGELYSVTDRLGRRRFISADRLN